MNTDGGWRSTPPSRSWQIAAAIALLYLGLRLLMQTSADAGLTLRVVIDVFAAPAGIVAIAVLVITVLKARN